jgi:rRNA maturation endonuclease Nob1
MLQVRVDNIENTVQLEYPIYLDGLTSQEVARGHAALCRAAERVADAAEAYGLIDERLSDINESLSGLVDSTVELAEMDAEIELIERDLALLPDFSEEESEAEENDSSLICSSCQKPVPPGKRFCPSCGSPL